MRLQLLQNLLPPSMTSVLGQSGALSGSKESVCHVRSCAYSAYAIHEIFKFPFIIFYVQILLSFFFSFILFFNAIMSFLSFNDHLIVRFDVEVLYSLAVTCTPHRI